MPRSETVKDALKKAMWTIEEAAMFFASKEDLEHELSVQRIITLPDGRHMVVRITIREWMEPEIEAD